MSTATYADPSTVQSVTVWWRKRLPQTLADGPYDCWWFSVLYDGYQSIDEPFPAELMADADTRNDAVVLIAARFGVVLDRSDVVDWYPDRSARWQRDN